MGAGTRLTLNTALKTSHPFLSIDLNEIVKSNSVKEWIKEHKIKILNIAGPRESLQPGIYKLAYQFLEINLV